MEGIQWSYRTIVRRVACEEDIDAGGRWMELKMAGTARGHPSQTFGFFTAGKHAG